MPTISRRRVLTVPPRLDGPVSLLLEAAMKIAFPLCEEQRYRFPPVTVVRGQQAKDCLGSVA